MMRKTLPLGALLALALLAGGCGRESSTDLVASGQALLEKKDPKGAAIQFRNALQKDGSNGPARFYLGKVLLEGGEPAAAQVELRKALELRVPDELVMPELARAMLLTGEEGKLLSQFGQVALKDPAAQADFKTSLGAAYAIQRQPDKARAAVEEALRLRPGFGQATILLARLKALDGDFDGAIAMVDSVLANEPANDRAGVLKGELQLAGRRDPDAALASFRQVLKAKPGSVAAHLAAANILFQQHRNDEARAELEQLKKVAPRHPDTLFFEAQLAFSEKNYKRTRELADEVLKLMPDNVRTLELAGAAEFRMNGFVQAETFLAKAVKLAPKQLLTRHMLAQTYLRSGQPAKALEALQPALEGPSPDATTLSMVGEAHLQLGDPKRSEEAFKRALKIAPGDNRLRTTAAMAQLARGNTAAAAAELEAVAAGDSGPQADLALVSARMRQGDMAGALKAIEGLEKKMPGQALPLQLRGRVQMMRKDSAGARRAYEAALARDPAYFSAVAALAALDVAAQKPEEARKRFDAYLKAYPKSWQAKLAMAELDTRIGAAPAVVQATLREAIKLNPTEPRPHLALINHMLGHEDARAALQVAQEATAALPDNPEVMDAKGRAELAAGDHQGAISTFKKLASLQPRSALPEMRLSDAYMGAQDRAAAARSLRKASELQPELTAPQRLLALLNLQDGRPNEALDIARALQKAHPADPAGWLLEADIETARKAWAPAANAYRAALKLSPDSADLFIKLHGALDRAGQSSEAHRMAADWLKAHPKDPAFLYYLGDLALADNDLPRAERRYRAVLEVMPDHALAMNNVAWLMARQGKPGALPLAEKANQLMPNRAALLDTLATVLEAENQLPRAIEAQKRAIAAAPKDPALNLRLAKLYIKSGDKAGARTELDGLAKLGERFSGQAEVAELQKKL